MLLILFHQPAGVVFNFCKTFLTNDKDYYVQWEAASFVQSVYLDRMKVDQQREPVLPSHLITLLTVDDDLDFIQKKKFNPKTYIYQWFSEDSADGCISSHIVKSK